MFCHCGLSLGPEEAQVPPMGDGADEQWSPSRRNKPSFAEQAEGQGGCGPRERCPEDEGPMALPSVNNIKCYEDD